MVDLHPLVIDRRFPTRVPIDASDYRRARRVGNRLDPLIAERESRRILIAECDRRYRIDDGIDIVDTLSQRSQECRHGRSLARASSDDYAANAMTCEIVALEGELGVRVVVTSPKVVAGRPSVVRVPIPEPVIVKQWALRPQRRPKLLMPRECGPKDQQRGTGRRRFICRTNR